MRGPSTGHIQLGDCSALARTVFKLSATLTDNSDVAITRKANVFQGLMPLYEQESAWFHHSVLSHVDKEVVRGQWRTAWRTRHTSDFLVLYEGRRLGQ